MGKVEVTIESDVLIKAEQVRGRGSEAYPLSNLDHMMRLHNVRLVYYYKNVTKKPNSELIQAFEKSFKDVLKSCPAVCGRLHKRDRGNWEIKCNNAGVKVVKATVHSTLENWLQIADRSAELKLCTWEDLKTDDLDNFPLVYVQFNAFKEGDGLAIGISCGHMLADASCLTLIMKVWGEFHSEAEVSPKPFFHSAYLKARAKENNETTATRYYTTFQTRDDMVKKCKSHDGRSIEFKTVTFKFSDDEVKECISRIKSDKHKEGKQLTAFEALSALFWAACIRAKKQHGERERLSICTEFRRMIFPNLPPDDYSFGNALHFSEVLMSTEDLTNLRKDPTNFSKDELSKYLTHLWGPANAIKVDMSQLKEKQLMRSVIDWLENQKNKEVERHLYGPHLTAINGENFFTYESVFEEGEKPLHVSYYVEPMLGDGLIFVLPSAEGNLSRTVMLTLPEQQASSACQYLKTFEFVPKPGMMK